ncbi:MAG: hypothetical protein ACFFAJ_02270 [Candidatus Hodarchaeota archaeon]
MSNLKSIDRSEAYLRYIEEELLIKGGRWIATFDHAIRSFNINLTSNDKSVKQDKDFDLVVYGGVRAKGFVLSRAFSFIASPTYKVACVVVNLDRASQVKWSFVIKWLREAQTLKEAMEFEWLWVLFFGEEELKDSIIRKIKRHTQRDLAILYADIKNNTLTNSDSFIARRGEKLFHPSNLDKQRVRFKFLRRSKGD